MHILKALTLIFLLALGGCNQNNATEKEVTQKTEKSKTLEYKVASIDAGVEISESDISIIRARNLLDAAELVYGLPKDRIADIAAKSQDLAKKSGLSVQISELLDWALIACDAKCGEPELVDYMAAYILTRTTTSQNHHQAIHGLVILNNINSRLKSN